MPFTSPPNLHTETTFSDCLVVEQKPDHFRIKNPNPFSRDLTWEARGIPIVSNTTACAVLQVPITSEVPQLALSASDFAKTNK